MMEMVKKIALIFVLFVSVTSCDEGLNLKRKFYSLIGKGEPKEEEIKENYNKRVIEYTKQKDEFVKSLDVSYRWDTIFFPYSIQYEEILNSTKQLLVNPKILDIFEKKSKIVARISSRKKEIDYDFSKKFRFNLFESDFSNEYIFDLVVDEIILNKLLQYEYKYFFSHDVWEFDYDFENDIAIAIDEDKHYYPYYYMVVDVNTFKKIPKVLFTSEAESNFSYSVEEDDVGRTIYDEDEISIYNSIGINFTTPFYYGKGKLIDFVHIKPENFDELIKKGKNETD